MTNSHLSTTPQSLVGIHRRLFAQRHRRLTSPWVSRSCPHCVFPAVDQGCGWTEVSLSLLWVVAESVAKRLSQTVIIAASLGLGHGVPLIWLTIAGTYLCIVYSVFNVQVGSFYWPQVNCSRVQLLCSGPGGATISPDRANFTIKFLPLLLTSTQLQIAVRLLYALFQVVSL